MMTVAMAMARSVDDRIGFLSSPLPQCPSPSTLERLNFRRLSVVVRVIPSLDRRTPFLSPVTLQLPTSPQFSFRGQRFSCLHLQPRGFLTLLT